MKNSDVRPASRYYVYTLAHPNGMIFYVGKGSKNRAQMHLTEARKRTCRCDKCLIIHKIWKDRLEVEIEYVFETDDEGCAKQYEHDLIMRLQSDYPLCNMQLNIVGFRHRSPDRAQQMTLEQYRTHLSYYDLTKQEVRQLLKEFGWIKTLTLEERLDRELRRRNFDAVREIVNEIELLNAAVGRVNQLKMF